MTYEQLDQLRVGDEVEFDLEDPDEMVYAVVILLDPALILGEQWAVLTFGVAHLRRRRRAN